MDIVMNDFYIRSNILVFFRTKKYKECKKCNKTCSDNFGNIKNKFVQWGNFRNCHECFKNKFLKKTDNIF